MNQQEQVFNFFNQSVTQKVKSKLSIMDILICIGFISIPLSLAITIIPEGLSLKKAKVQALEVIDKIKETKSIGNIAITDKIKNIQQTGNMYTITLDGYKNQHKIELQNSGDVWQCTVYSDKKEKMKNISGCLDNKE